jgi:hypothetical protein
LYYTTKVLSSSPSSTRGPMNGFSPGTWTKKSGAWAAPLPIPRWG